MPNKPSKPLLRLNTCGLDKIREEKTRQGSTAVRRRGSKDKDARNRELKATKATERTMQGEADVFTQTTGATKGRNVLPMLKPRDDEATRTPRPPRLAIGSNSTPLDGKNVNGLQSLPRCDLAVSSSASRATSAAIAAYSEQPRDAIHSSNRHHSY